MAKWLSEAYRDFGLSILSLGQADGDAVGKVPVRSEDGSQEDATTEPTRAHFAIVCCGALQKVVTEATTMTTIGCLGLFLLILVVLALTNPGCSHPYNQKVCGRSVQVRFYVVRVSTCFFHCSVHGFFFVRACVRACVRMKPGVLNEFIKTAT